MVRHSRSSVRSSRSSAKANILRGATAPVFDSLEQRRMLSAAGDLDTTFGGTGIVTEPLDGQSQGMAVAVDNATGKVVVGATFNDGSPRIAVVRYLHNGTLDPSFDGDGILTTQIDINNEDETVTDVLVVGTQVLITGTVTDADVSDSDIYVMRLNDDGTIAATYVFDLPGDQTASKMVVDGAGNIYVCGIENDDSLIIKLDPTGTPDPLFGSGGFAVNDLGSSETISDIALQANGPGTLDDQLILAGLNGTVGGAILARFSAVDGSLDTDYGTDLTGVVGFNGTDTYFDIEIGSDNSVYAVTDAVFSGRSVLAVYKHDSDGARDLTFDGDGETIADAGVGFTMSGFGIALAGGNVIASGHTFDDNLGTYDISVARWSSSTGAQDATFGTGGLVQINNQDYDLNTEVAVDSDSNIVVTGVTLPSDALTSSIITARLLGAASSPPPTPVHVDVNGNLIIPGTAGNDIFSVTSAGADVHVVYNGTDAGNWSFSGGIKITGLAGDDLVTVANDVVRFTTITGGAGNDTLTGGGGNDSINGGTEDDILSGQSGDDTLRGAAGNDYLDGGDDNDDLLGGADNDTSIGGNGNDSVANDGGDDELQGNAGDDTLKCGGGADEAHGGSGNDSIVGGTGNDSLYGEADNDTINGGAGNDFIDGGSGNDDLNGGNDSDIVVGGTGQDIVQGGAARDILIGGDDADSIIGNAEEDVLIAGTTSYDSDQTSLNSALTIWNGAGTYASRVAALSSTYFSTTGTITVFDDGDVDTLTGGSGTDWFLFNSDPGAIDIIDLHAGETATDID